MIQYLLLIQNNAKTQPKEDQWNDFFAAARESGTFIGGSEVGDREFIGDTVSAKQTDHIVGYMRFDSEERSKLTDLLKMHPIVLNGGTIELCELPKS